LLLNAPWFAFLTDNAFPIGSEEYTARDRASAQQHADGLRGTYNYSPVQYQNDLRSSHMRVTGLTSQDLAALGIEGTTEVVHNPDFDTLFTEELRPELEGYARGKI